MPRPNVSKKKIAAKAAGSSSLATTPNSKARKNSSESATSKAHAQAQKPATPKTKVSSPRQSTTALKQEIIALKTEIELLKDKEANLKLELASRTRAANPVPATLLKEFADMSDDVRRLRSDVVDLGNNVFHLHRVVKDSGNAVEHKVGRLFLWSSLLVIVIAMLVSFGVLYWQLNPNNYGS